MSFGRHEEIYRPIGARMCRAPRHRFDEFPVGYSLAGCSPAEPASASPTGSSVSGPVQRDNRKAANGDVSLFLLSHSGYPPHSVPFRSVSLERCCTSVRRQDAALKEIGTAQKTIYLCE